MSYAQRFDKVVDVVPISGIQSQAAALRLCGCFEKLGVRATVGLFPWFPGYQVVVHQLSPEDVAGMLQRLGVKFEIAADHD